MSYKEGLLKTIENWFFSDFDIQFVLKKGRERLLCKFENDAWYEHINDPVRNVTVKSIRHHGSHRRFIAQEGSDKIFQEIKHLASMDRLYTKEELVDLVEELSETYQILDAEKWDS